MLLQIEIKLGTLAAASDGGARRRIRMPTMCETSEPHPLYRSSTTILTPKVMPLDYPVGQFASDMTKVNYPPSLS
jgi:hypothetical protein